MNHWTTTQTWLSVHGQKAAIQMPQHSNYTLCNSSHFGTAAGFTMSQRQVTFSHGCIHLAIATQSYTIWLCTISSQQLSWVTLCSMSRIILTCKYCGIFTNSHQITFKENTTLAITIKAWLTYSCNQDSTLMMIWCMWLIDNMPTWQMFYQCTANLPLADKLNWPLHHTTIQSCHYWWWTVGPWKMVFASTKNHGQKMYRTILSLVWTFSRRN